MKAPFKVLGYPERRRILLCMACI